MTQKMSPLMEERIKKAERLRAMGLNPYATGFHPDVTVGEVLRRFGSLDGETIERESASFRLAGRVMALRGFGKASFIQLQDRSGRIQAYVRKDKVPPGKYEVFGLVDVGDFLGIQGRLFRTRTGELTVLAEDLELLTKSLRPLPEKWHGLTDIETRYRQRYLDLIANEPVREVFVLRSRIIQAVRSFFVERDFLEVETPMMQAIPGGATARPFKTYHNALAMSLYLRVAPELFLKRLVVGGFERVFEVNRNFRNEGVSVKHNPEFTMLEFYMAYGTFEDLMTLTEELFGFVLKTTLGRSAVQYQGKDIDFAPPWPRVSFFDSLREIGGVPEEALAGKEAALAFGERSGIPLDPKETHGKILTKIFDQVVESRLIRPTFVVGYPTDVSPLSRRNDHNPMITDRFELFIGGWEIANGFSELNDPLDQRQRFEQQVALRAAGDEEAQFMDDDFLNALEHGMPPTAGEGIGIDRVVMLLTDSPSIRDVILFPHMRSRQD